MPHKRSSWIHPSTRWALYARDNFRCAYCLTTLQDILADEWSGNFLTIDHIVAAKSGQEHNHDPFNLVTACRFCNSSKAKLSLSAFCKREGLVYSTIRRRLWHRRHRPLDHFRVAGKLLTGGKAGFQPAPEVMHHNRIVMRQWQKSVGEMDEALEQYAGEMPWREMWCPTCGKPTTRFDEDRYVPPPPGDEDAPPWVYGEDPDIE